MMKHAMVSDEEWREAVGHISMYLETRPDKEDAKATANRMFQSALAGDPIAAFDVAQILPLHERLRHSRLTTLFLTMAAKGGITAAMDLLAVKDQHWLKKAATAGSEEARWMLTPRNKLCGLLDLEFLGGGSVSPFAAFYVAQSFQFGLGCTSNVRSALQLYRKLASLTPEPERPTTGPTPPIPNITVNMDEQRKTSNVQITTRLSSATLRPVPRSRVRLLADNTREQIRIMARFAEAFCRILHQHKFNSSSETKEKSNAGYVGLTFDARTFGGLSGVPPDTIVDANVLFAYCFFRLLDTGRTYTDCAIARFVTHGCATQTLYCSSSTEQLAKALLKYAQGDFRYIDELNEWTPSMRDPLSLISHHIRDLLIVIAFRELGSDWKSFLQQRDSKRSVRLPICTFPLRPDAELEDMSCATVAIILDHRRPQFCRPWPAPVHDGTPERQLKEDVASNGRVTAAMQLIRSLVHRKECKISDTFVASAQQPFGSAQQPFGSAQQPFGSLVEGMAAQSAIMLAFSAQIADEEVCFHLDAAVGHEPTNLFLRMLRALWLIHYGRVDLAIGPLTQMIQEAHSVDTTFTALIARASARLVLHSPMEALVDSQLAIRILPDNMAAWILARAAFEQLLDRPETEACSNRIRSSTKHAEKIGVYSAKDARLAAAGWAFAAGRFEIANRAFSLASTQSDDPLPGLVLHHHMRTLIMLGRPADALSLFDLHFPHVCEPKHQDLSLVFGTSMINLRGSLLVTRAVAMQRLGQHKEAESAANEILLLHPNMRWEIEPILSLHADHSAQSSTCKEATLSFVPLPPSPTMPDSSKTDDLTLAVKSWTMLDVSEWWVPRLLYGDDDQVIALVQHIVRHHQIDGPKLLNTMTRAQWTEYGLTDHDCIVAKLEAARHCFLGIRTRRRHV